MNTVLLGPLLGNNRAHLIERCADLVADNQSHKFLYLAASQPLLEVVTDGILDGTRNRGVWGELPVYLFRGFVETRSYNCNQTSKARVSCLACQSIVKSYRSSAA